MYPAWVYVRGMKLSVYLETMKVKPEEFARKLGDASASGVLKWARGERVPRPDQQRRIFEVTQGAVTPNDFILELRAAG